MHRILQLACAIGVATTAPSHAQTNSTIRPSTDSSVTTGVGSSSSFRNVPPPDLPVPSTSGAFIANPQVQERRADETDDRGSRTPGNAAPPPAAEVKEDPRTMITRDRIESPQH